VKLKAPIIAIRDLEIQARESDLVAASFGRGFFVLDDYAALRGLTPQLLSQEGALFAPGRKARQYDEIGYYRAQGDNLASPNPPMGALLTYYLREDLPNAAAGAAGPKMVPTIADSTGKQVRQLDASSKAGLHRTPWDLREAAPAGQPGGRGTGQPAAAPPAAGGGQEAGTQPPPQGGRGGRGRRIRRAWIRALGTAGESGHVSGDARQTGRRDGDSGGAAADGGGSSAGEVVRHPTDRSLTVAALIGALMRRSEPRP